VRYVVAVAKEATSMDEANGYFISYNPDDGLWYVTTGPHGYDVVATAATEAEAVKAAEAQEPNKP
jgi:hypothetical protein